MRISDWSSDVCSSDLPSRRRVRRPLYALVLYPSWRLLPRQFVGRAEMSTFWNWTCWTSRPYALRFRRVHPTISLSTTPYPNDRLDVRRTQPSRAHSYSSTDTTLRPPPPTPADHGKT